MSSGNYGGLDFDAVKALFRVVVYILYKSVLMIYKNVNEARLNYLQSQIL